ncbi:MAG: polyprenyl synthetase family protein [Planctomycetota bacterium]
MNASALSRASIRPRTDVPQSLWDVALNDPLERCLSVCGKRIRASMVVESYRCAGGHDDPPRAIVDAIELLHAGSLIVDDIEDDSHERRGTPTLHREIGIPLALNTGNWMYFRSLERLSEAEVSAKTKYGMLQCVTRTARRCHEGQALDIAARVDELRTKEIEATARTISRLKTGGLTALSSRLGASAAGADRATRHALGRFGMSVGVCLQMHNDLTELQGVIAGGIRFDDLRNARVTWPWAWATRISRTETCRLQTALRSSTAPHQFRSVARDLNHLIGAYGAESISARLERAIHSLKDQLGSAGGFASILSKLQPGT